MHLRKGMNDRTDVEMTPAAISEILQGGERIEVEFKTSLLELPKNTFESIRSFFNRTLKLLRQWHEPESAGPEHG